MVTRKVLVNGGSGQNVGGYHPHRMWPRLGSWQPAGGSWLPPTGVNPVMLTTERAELLTFWTLHPRHVCAWTLTSFPSRATCFDFAAPDSP